MSKKEKPPDTPFERMRALAAQVVSVPKAEVDKAEKRWRDQRAKTRAEKKLR